MPSLPPLFLPLPQQVERLNWRQGVEARAGEGLAGFLGGVEEKGELVGVDFAIGFAGAADARTADVLDAQFAQELSGAIEDFTWHARQTRDVDAVTSVGAAFDDAVQEDHLIFPLAHRDVEIFHALEASGKIGE